MAQRDTESSEKASERRESPRRRTFFIAVEHEGDDVYYRVVTNLSASGCSFEDPAVPRAVGDAVTMEFARAGGGAPFRVRGQVTRTPVRQVGTAAGRQVGMRFLDAPVELAQLIAELPRR